MHDSLSNHVTVNRQFLRSVRVDADFGRIDALQGFILQPSAKGALETMGKHLSATQQRAFTWTGPYGGGKSSLALALASLAGGDSRIRKVARTTLGLVAADPLLKYFGLDQPWTVLNIVGSRTSVVESIGVHLDKDVRARGRKPQLQGKRDVIAELVRAAEAKGGDGGVLLILDELGKFLEHAAHAGDDVGFFQDLAEAASRCRGKLVIVGVLHQSFEQYALRLGQVAQQEWAKVQGRYVDIPLVAASDEVVGLIGRALQVQCEHAPTAATADIVAKVIRSRRPSAAGNLATLLDACWPLHPLTAALLGPASKKKFGQNERSVFSFLASAEPLAFTEILNGLPAKASSYYYPDQFWDYLKANFEPAILVSPDGHRWASCSEAIERAEARLSKLHVALTKTVSLIELLRNGSGLAAERELLKICVPKADAARVEAALNELSSASILIFRKHLGAYGVFAGSDFDIESAIRNAMAHAEADPARLSNLVDLGPVTARRHYWLTGAMRWFSRVVLQESKAEEYVRQFRPAGSQCGEFLLLLGDGRSQNRSLDRVAKRLSEDSEVKGLLLGSPKSSELIEDLLSELSALEFVRANSLELHGDAIATAEVNGRLRAVRASLSEELRDAFQHATWYYRGHVARKATIRGLSHFASDVADDLFPLSPHVHSELLNRNVLSSAAAKAQRDLLHSMLTKAGESNLGYETFSADAGLYYTAVRALGLHRQHKNGWRFSEPHGSERSAQVLPAWEAAKELVLQQDRAVLLSDLYGVWRSSPFGIKEGLLPVLALAFFLTYRNQLALYVEGAFTPEISEAHIDEWLQDPKRIEWRYVRIEASDKKMLHALSAALSYRLGKQVSADTLDSARALVALVYQLPAWTRRTESLTAKAKDVRRILLGAKDPHKVLFADLPLILETRDAAKLAVEIAAIAGELSDAFEARLRKAQGRLFNALDHDGNIERLNDRGRTVAGIGADFKLDAFATRLSTFTGQVEDAEGLMMLAIGKPSKDWSDHDVNEGEVQLLSWAFEFRRLETVAEVRGRTSTRRAIGVVFAAGRTVTGTFDVSTQDQCEVQNLANEFVAKLGKGIKGEILLAAIAEAGAEVYTQLAHERRLSHG